MFCWTCSLKEPLNHEILVYVFFFWLLQIIPENPVPEILHRQACTRCVWLKAKLSDSRECLDLNPNSPRPQNRKTYSPEPQRLILAPKVHSPNSKMEEPFVERLFRKLFSGPLTNQGTWEFLCFKLTPQPQSPKPEALIPKWQFPKIGGPNIVPYIVGSLFIRTPK